MLQDTKKPYDYPPLFPSDAGIFRLTTQEPTSDKTPTPESEKLTPPLHALLKFISLLFIITLKGDKKQERIK